MDLFMALGNENRREMLKILMHESMHISRIARELNIAAPVALKHVRILEETGLVERSRIGNTHVLEVRNDAAKKIEKIVGLLEKTKEIGVQKGCLMVEVLKKVPGIKIQQEKEGALITEVNGKKGYFIYEVNGKIPKKSVDKFRITKGVDVALKQLLPVAGKKVRITIKK